MFSRFAGSGFQGLALTPPLDQLFFLAADQFGLPARLFLTPSQLYRVNHRLHVDFSLPWRIRAVLSDFHAVFTAHKSSFFTDLNLDRAGLARRIRLLDFTG